MSDIDNEIEIAIFLSFPIPNNVPHSRSTHFDDVVDVNLPVLVVVESLGDALQLVLGNVLDLPHDVDELVDADQVLPKGIEQTVYRKRLPDLTGRKMWWRSLGSTCCIQGSQKKHEPKKHTNQKNLRAICHNGRIN